MLITRNTKSVNRHKISLLTAAISAVLFPFDTYAQGQGFDSQSQIEEVVVTGSRITRFEGDYTAPVLSLGADQIEGSGKVNVEDFVSEIASLVGSTGSQESSVASNGTRTGVNSLNMRNLGDNRTLVLVNGRRHVSSIASGEPLVDINTIPTALIERVDVLTGGASAVYGADAVSGAVNFVLKDDFEGFSMRIQGGTSSHRDAGENFASFVWGKNFGDGAGNVTASYEYRNQKRLEIQDRDYAFAKMRHVVNNPAEFRKTDDPNVPDRILASDRRYNFTTPTGRYDISGYDKASGAELSFGELALKKDGQPIDEGTLVSGATALGGDGTPTVFFSGRFLLPETEVNAFNLNGRYDLNDNATVFGEFKYVRSTAESARPFASYTSKLELSLDNPFITSGLRDAISRVQDPIINMARDDLAIRSINENTRDTVRGVLGVRGDLTDWLAYEVSMNYGATDVEARILNLRREDRYFASMDAVLDPNTGQATCRSNLYPSIVPPTDYVVSSYNPAAWGNPVNMTFTPGPNSGCVPFDTTVDGTKNWFKPAIIDQSNPNAAAIAFITGDGRDLVDHGKVEQSVLNGFVSGDSTGLGFSLPAGPVDFVLGGEYREEKVRNNVDPVRGNPNGLTEQGYERNSASSYDVSEFFSEVSLPVFEDLGPLLQGLRLDGAYRYSDYSTIGLTRAYSVGANWTLNQSIIVRASFGESVRAPNLAELYSPDNEGAFRPTDPCEQFNLSSQSADTIANCQAELSGLGIDPTNFVSASPGSRPGIIGGNPNLSEEVSETQTIGIVLTPSFLSGLVVSADFWEISLSQGILYPSDDEIVAQCYDSPTMGNEFCSAFTRSTDGLGIIIDFESRPINVSSLTTSGVDFSMSYTTDLGFDAGILSLGLNGSYLRNLETQPTIAQRLVDEAGMVRTLLGQQAPKWVANFNADWIRGPITLNYRVHHQSELSLFKKEELRRQPDISNYLHTDALFLHDIQGSYNFDNGIKMYLGVNNITDREPAPSFVSLPVGPKGRFVYAGFTANFEDLSQLNPFR